MRCKFFWFLILSTFSFSIFAKGINKCIIDGSTVYTHKNCPTKESKAKIRWRNSFPPSESKGSKPLQAPIIRRNSSSEINQDDKNLTVKDNKEKPQFSRESEKLEIIQGIDNEIKKLEIPEAAEADADADAKNVSGESVKAVVDGNQPTEKENIGEIDSPVPSDQE